MSHQSTAPLDRTELTQAATTAYGLMLEHRDGALLLDAPYQRGSVWTANQRIALVRSWLLALPIPAVILNDRRAGHWTDADGHPDFTIAVVDGRQRMETAIAWFDSNLPVPASWFPAEQVATTVDTADGPYVTYDGLTTEAKVYTKRLFRFPTATASVSTLADEAAIYLLVNGAGTVQTQDDLDNARSYV